MRTMLLLPTLARQRTLLISGDPPVAVWPLRLGAPRPGCPLAGLVITAWSGVCLPAVILVITWCWCLLGTINGD